MFKRLRKLMFACLGCVTLLLSGCIFNTAISAELTASEITLDVDTGKQLAIKNVKYGNSLVPTTNYSYVWTSSNVEVAKVGTNGFVTGISQGFAEIAANISVVGKSQIFRASCKVTVIDNNPVSIYLNKTSADVQQGKKLSLVATVEHSLNKNVSWTSDNDSITVENGVVKVGETVEAGTKATITATSLADSNATASCIITVIPAGSIHYDYTIMLYMCASTLEHDSSKTPSNIGLFSKDIQEILSVDLPETVKIIIETGGTKKWHMPSEYLDGATAISNSRLQRWEVEDGKIKLIETLNTNKMASQESFENFLEWGLNDYEADQMGVVVSGHGAGIGGCAVDDNNDNKALSVSNLALASSNVLSASNRDKFTWIGFDCCLMQCADVASILSDYYDYMVASQENEIGQGWNHDVYLEELAKNTKISPNDLLPVIASSFVDQFDKNLLYCNPAEPCYQTMSVIDLEKMDSFVTEFNAFISNVGYTASAYKIYRLAFNSSLSFGEGIYGLVDLNTYLRNISNKTSVSCEAVLNALDDAVISNSYCTKYLEHPSGLNAFLPECLDLKKDLQVVKADYMGNVTKFKNYQTMCLNYGRFFDSYL